MDGDPEIVVLVIDSQDDLELAASVVNADEVGAIAIDEYRQAGVAQRRRGVLALRYVDGLL